MSEHQLHNSPAGAMTRLAALAREWAAPLIRPRVFGSAIIASLVAAFYWGIVASDRYVSEAHVMVQRTDFGGQASIPNLGSLLGAPGAGNSQDQLLLKDHLLSVDMAQRVDAALNLREHYSDFRRDPISRMWFKDAKLERFHLHFLSRVSVEFDEFTGILTIKAQAYDPKKAHAIATLLVEEGERFMNELANDLAREQVAFLEKQVDTMQKRVLEARKAVLTFQNQKGLLSPDATAANFAAIVNNLEAQIAGLQARRNAMLGYLQPNSAGIVELDLQIAAIEKQARLERARLASPDGKTLNRTVEEFQRLQLHAEFAQDVYKTALGALEVGHVESTRKLKKLSVVQRPFEPQDSVEPRRLYNTIVFTLLALVIAGIVQLLSAIIREHKD